MKKNILSKLAVLLVLVVASGCKTKKLVVAPPPVKEEIKVDQSKADALTLLRNQQFKFNTLALKAKANLDINGEANDVTMNIRIKDKETIWVSITAVGGIVEVARAMITPDSIKIIDKLHSKYTKKPFSYIYGFTNKQLNFNTLQAILTGNAISDFLSEKSDIQKESGVWTIKGQNDGLDFKLIFNTLSKVSETDLNDAKNAQALKVNYSNYQKIGDLLFPSGMKVNTLSGKKKINIDLEFTKIESNVPIDFPFTVQKRFEVIN